MFLDTIGGLEKIFRSEIKPPKGGTGEITPKNIKKKRTKCGI